MTKRSLAFGCLIVSFFAFSACTNSGPAPAVQKGRTPEEVVRSFVELSAGSKAEDDKKRLQELCLGEMRRTFERMNEEAFRLIYLDSKVTILDFKVLESKIDGEAARVAY